MRERITFVQKLGDSLEPTAVKVADGTIRGPDVRAAREDRITIAYDELPTELQALLKNASELHIRWVSSVPYEAVSPLLARLPPGFHVIYSPGPLLEPPDAATTDRLCSTLANIFGDVSCSTFTDSCTSLPNDRASGLAVLQYFQRLDDLSHFIQYAKNQLCPASDASCSDRLEKLSEASLLELSYDAGSHALRVSALWPYQKRLVYASSRPGIRTEVGILSTDKPQTLEPHEIGISGLLTVLGQDSKPSPTMFTFAARHRDTEATFSAKFLSPTGLHPTLQLRLASNKPPPSSEGESCSLHAYLTLPKTIFPDKYQLSDPLFLASKNLSALKFTTRPVDLEAPAYVLPQWGSALLVELSPPEPRSQSQSAWTAEIPLHLRYLAPTWGGYSTIAVPYPAVFWACAPEEGTEFPRSPFDGGKLGYDGLFGEGTVFWHVEPRPAGGSKVLVNEVRVPVLDMERAGWVNAGTALAVLAGFAWVVLRLAGVAWNRGRYEAREEKKRQ